MPTCPAIGPVPHGPSTAAPPPPQPDPSADSSDGGDAAASPETVRLNCLSVPPLPAATTPVNVPAPMPALSLPEPTAAVPLHPHDFLTEEEYANLEDVLESLPSDSDYQGVTAWEDDPMFLAAQQQLLEMQAAGTVPDTIVSNGQHGTNMYSLDHVLNTFDEFSKP